MICPCYESSIPGPNWALILIANPHNVIPGWCELSQKYYDLLCHEIRMVTLSIIIKGCLKSNPGALGPRSSRDHQFKRCGSSEFFYNSHSQIPQIIIMPLHPATKKNQSLCFQGKGLGSGHKTLLYGNAILLRHSNSDM